MQGELRIKIKKNGSFDSKKTGIWVGGKRKYPISKDFILSNELNKKECVFEIDNNSKVIKLIIEDKEIKKINKPQRVKKCKDREYLIPNDTCLYIEKEQIDNLNLRINKFVSNDFDDSKDKYELRIDKPNISFQNQREKIDLYYNTLENFTKNNKIKCEFFLKIKNRLIIGLGLPSVYETSITLHHIYGVPYIPASAIKGSFRSYLIHKYFENELEKYSDYSKFENEILFKTKWFVDIFGTEDKQGKVIFFDAFSEDVKIQKDIMTPHYGDYYSDTKNKIAPTDTQSPNPIPFLTISGKFKFVFGVKKDFEVQKQEKILRILSKLLKKSLQEFGIGAKTAVGYGYFQ